MPNHENPSAPHATPGHVSIGLVQMSCSSSKEKNLQKALDRIAEAAAAGANIVCLQELFAGFIRARAKITRASTKPSRFPGRRARHWPQLRKKHGVVVVGSLFERRAAGLYHNTAVMFDADGTTAGMYRKMHIPDDPLYYEKFYFTPGDLGFRGGRHASLAASGRCVCWDQWYPEAARLTALPARRFCSIRRPSVGCTPRKRNTARASTRPGKP